MNQNNIITYTDVILSESRFLDALRQINPNLKTIIFIEAFSHTIPLIRQGVEKGYNILILTANSLLRRVSSEIIGHSRLIIEVDTLNEKQILSVVQRLRNDFPIHAVIPGLEYFVPIAAKVSEFLELPTMRSGDVMKLRNKALMRLNLDRAGISIPKYRIVTSFEELKRAMRDIGFPAICKPSDAIDNDFSKKVSSIQEARQAAAAIFQGNNLVFGDELSQTVLYEEYIEGIAYQVEGTITRNNIHFFNISAVESNTPAVDAYLKQKIEIFVEEIIQILRPDFCPFNAEVCLDAQGNLVFIDMALRLSDQQMNAFPPRLLQEVYHAYLGESNPPITDQISLLKAALS